jgi:hypothetical protein
MDYYELAQYFFFSAVFLLLCWNLLIYIYRQSNWRINPTRCERLSDNTLWYPIGDCPFPIQGWNFVRINKARVGWLIDRDDRWVFTESGLFRIEHWNE